MFSSFSITVGIFAFAFAFTSLSQATLPLGPRKDDSAPAVIRIKDKTYELPLPGPPYMDSIDIGEIEVDEAVFLDGPWSMYAYLYSDEGFLSHAMTPFHPIPWSHSGVSTRLYYTNFPPKWYAVFFEYADGRFQIYHMKRKEISERKYFASPQTVVNARVLYTMQEDVWCDILNSDDDKVGQYFMQEYNMEGDPVPDAIGFVCSPKLKNEFDFGHREVLEIPR